MIKSIKYRNLGFTMIELLVVISIIGVLIALSVFGLQGARESSRDAKRKSDLELIRSALELYKSDCGTYPTTIPPAGQALVGDGSSSNCVVSNVYATEIPDDPVTTQNYYYAGSTTGYELCAALENGGSGTCSGSCGQTCNYKTVNP